MFTHIKVTEWRQFFNLTLSSEAIVLRSWKQSSPLDLIHSYFLKTRSSVGQTNWTDFSGTPLSVSNLYLWFLLLSLTCPADHFYFKKYESGSHLQSFLVVCEHLDLRGLSIRFVVMFNNRSEQSVLKCIDVIFLFLEVAQSKHSEKFVQHDFSIHSTTFNNLPNQRLYKQNRTKGYAEFSRPFKAHIRCTKRRRFCDS